jgi:hypothetical protein
MSITVPAAPVVANLFATSAERPIVVRAHARTSPGKGRTGRPTEADRRAASREAREDRMRRSLSVLDDILSAIDGGMSPGLIRSYYGPLLTAAAR